MYDFYPEWGPARHRDQADAHPQRRHRYWSAGAAVTLGATVSRDSDRERPDDN